MSSPPRRHDDTLSRKVFSTSDLETLRPGPALRAFERVAAAWQLTRAEKLRLLGGISSGTYAKWCAAPDEARLAPVVYERLSHVIGIWFGLRTLFGRGEASDGFVRRPNGAPPFGGREPLELVLSPWVGVLAEVRHWVEGECAR